MISPTISDELRKKLRLRVDCVLRKHREQMYMEREENRRRAEIREVCFLLTVVVVVAFLAASISSHVLRSWANERNDALNREAAVWLDISDARQCTEFQGMQDRMMIFGCRDGKGYRVSSRVYERAELMRAKAGAL